MLPDRSSSTRGERSSRRCRSGSNSIATRSSAASERSGLRERRPVDRGVQQFDRMGGRDVDAALAQDRMHLQRAARVRAGEHVGRDREHVVDFALADLRARSAARRGCTFRRCRSIDRRAGISTSSRPGIVRKSARGCCADAAARARGGRRRGTRRAASIGAARGARLERREELVDVAHAPGERLGARGPLRVAGEEFAVLLERRAAAGRVDDDRVDALALEALDQRAREALRLVGPPGVQRERAAAALASAARSPRSPRRCSTRIVAALTPGKNTRCTQPATSATARALGSVRGCERRQHAPADRPSVQRRQQRLELPQPRAAAGAGRRARAPARCKPLQRTRHRAAPAIARRRVRIREQREDQLAERAVARRARIALRSARASLRSADRSARPTDTRSRSPCSPGTRRCARRPSRRARWRRRATPFIRSMRPRGESISSPHDAYVGQAGRQKPQCTQSASKSRSCAARARSLEASDEAARIAAGASGSNRALSARIKRERGRWRPPRVDRARSAAAACAWTTSAPPPAFDAPRAQRASAAPARARPRLHADERERRASDSTAIARASSSAAASGASAARARPRRCAAARAIVATPRRAAAARAARCVGNARARRFERSPAGRARERRRARLAASTPRGETLERTQHATRGACRQRQRRRPAPCARVEQRAMRRHARHRARPGDDATREVSGSGCRRNVAVHDRAQRSERADHQLGQVEAGDVLDDLAAAARQRAVGPHERRRRRSGPSHRAVARAPRAEGVGGDRRRRRVARSRSADRAPASGRVRRAAASSAPSVMPASTVIDLVGGRVLDDAVERARAHARASSARGGAPKSSSVPPPDDDRESPCAGARSADCTPRVPRPSPVPGPRAARCPAADVIRGPLRRVSSLACGT